MRTEKLSWEIVTHGSERTRELARQLGSLLESGDVLSLDGPLGAGKTCFTQGLAAGLGVPDAGYLSSPSYTLMNEYTGRLSLYHFDAYFAEKAESLSEAGADDYLFGSGVCVIEWGERVAELLPEDRWSVQIEILGMEKRGFRIEGPRDRLERLRDLAGVERE